MTGSELKAAAIELYGERGWQSSLAESLGKERTQIWRYVRNDSVPTIVSLAVEQLLAIHRTAHRPAAPADS
jgi:hypothetical protein